MWPAGQPVAARESWSGIPRGVCDLQSNPLACDGHHVLQAHARIAHAMM